MDDELLDLIPLFVSEARERVARLRELTPLFETSRPALVEARRELHTLKGSSRMLRLRAIGDLCHQAEELLEVVAVGTGARLLGVLERVSELVEGVMPSEGEGALAPAPAGATAGIEAHVVAPGPSQSPRLWVLLVEDSLTHREMVRRLLEDEGFDVLAVAGAREALDALGERAFDCLVTDVEMPGMNGLELTRRLRSRERSSRLPIVIVSTLDGADDRLAGLQAGADAYVSKGELRADLVGGLIRRLSGSR